MATEKEIRKRASYKKFETLYDSIKDKPIETQLTVIYNLLDSYSAFGSQSAATYSKESLDLLLKDKKQ